MKQTLTYEILRYRVRMFIERLIGPKTTYTVVDPSPESRYKIVIIFGRSGRVKMTQQVQKRPMHIPIRRVLETS